MSQYGWYCWVELGLFAVMIAGCFGSSRRISAYTREIASTLTLLGLGSSAIYHIQRACSDESSLTICVITFSSACLTAWRGSPRKTPSLSSSALRR